MKKLCVIGNPVINSFSPEIYNFLFDKFKIDAYYTRLILTDVNHFNNILELLKIDGANATMPHKQSAFSFAEMNDEYSSETEAVNTLIFNNIIEGYNTDYKGLEDIISNINISIDTNILLIGAGNTAITALRVLSKYDAKVDVINRNPFHINILNNFFDKVNQVDSSTLKLKYDLIINASADLEFISVISKYIESDIIIDFNYISPTLNKLVKSYNTYIDGLDLLIRQALYSFYRYNEKIFENKADIHSISRDEILSVIKSNLRKNNIAFVGFTGSGKSTFAKEISKELNMDYFSIDDEIEKRAEMTIKEIFYHYGESRFRQIESKVLEDVEKLKNTIIDTGGGLCQNPDNIEILKKSAFNIFLISDLKDNWNRLDKSQKPIVENMNFTEFEDFYYNRLDNYFRASDLIFYNNNHIEHSIPLLSEHIISYLCK